MIRLSDHSDFLDLIKGVPAGCPVHDGSVPNSPGYPYVLVRGGNGRPSSRSVNRTVLVRSVRWRVTVAGLSSESVRIIHGQVQEALEGARIDGQRVEQLPTYEGADPLMDEDVTLTNGAHPFYSVSEWQVIL